MITQTIRDNTIITSAYNNESLRLEELRMQGSNNKIRMMLKQLRASATIVVIPLDHNNKNGGYQ